VRALTARYNAGMRLLYSSMAILLATGCASTPAPPRTPERHAANIAAAEAAGYRVISTSDRTIFCPTAPPTGSHIGSMCLSEGEWEAATRQPLPPSPSVHVTNQSPGPGPGAGH
jgi:hypothetical protein